VIGEKLVRDSNMKCSWVIVRPTSVWGPWFEHAYRTFFRLVDRRLELLSKVVFE
jgi:GlcNAc-P-P-Und epimerase